MKKQINYPEVLIEIRPSKILPGEIGVFACRNLKKNTIIAKADVFKSELYSWNNLKKIKISQKTKNKIKSFCLGTEKGILLPPNMNNLSIPWQMNHSCEGNVGFDSNDDFVTIRDVKMGEELMWDYGLGECNPDFSMICKCNSKKCRKVITGNDWKKIKLGPFKKFMISYLKQKND